MCNKEENLPFVADFDKVKFGYRTYKVKVLHYYRGKEFNREYLPNEIANLVELAEKRGSKRMTAAWIDTGTTIIHGSAFCKNIPEDSGGVAEGRLRAKDRLRTIVEYLDGEVVWPRKRE